MFGAQGFNDPFQDLPLFEFTKLAVATTGFSIINKLGQGGFGLVYKVHLFSYAQGITSNDCLLIQSPDAIKKDMIMLYFMME